MPEPGHGADLADEAIGALSGAQDVWRQDLDCHLASESFVLGEEDRAHGAGSDPPQQLVLPEAREWKRFGRGRRRGADGG